MYLGLSHSQGGMKTQENTTTTAPGNTSLGSRKTYTLGISVGSTIAYNNSYTTGEGNVSQSTIYTVNITQIQWPLLLGVYHIQGSNSTGSAKMAVGNLLIPLELLGKKTVSVPVIIPAVNTGACANLTLQGERSLNLTGRVLDVYVYSMNLSTGQFRVAGVLAYNKSNGILVDANYTVYGKGEPLFGNRQYIVNATLTGRTRTMTPSDWFCTQPYSSDFRFTLEGTYLLQDGKLTPASIDVVRNVSLHTGIVGVIGKDGQEITLEFWKTLLEASMKCPQAKVYLVIVGPLSDSTQGAVARNILERGGAAESTVIVKFVDGVPGDKAYRYATLDELTSLLCGSS